MLKQAFSSTLKNTQSLLLKQEISFLCKRVAIVQLASRSFHSSQYINQEQQLVKEEEEVVKQKSKPPKDIENQLGPLELLRKEALKIEKAAALRPRCAWLKEEDEKLLRLVNEGGKRWTYMSYFFVDRSPSTLMNRYHLLTENVSRGPWSKEEVEALKKLGDGRTPEQIDETEGWEKIQSKLPQRRPIFLIRQKYMYSCNPTIKYGQWSEQESDKLARLISQHGEKNMSLVASFMKTRTKRQCLERWRWQMANTRKGRFSPEEDQSIIQAVKKYGENFAVVKKVIGSERTARHISQHYRNVLAPNIDRSPWTADEQLKVYETCLKNDGDMLKTKMELGTNRAIRDLWNHFIAQKRTEAFHRVNNN